jgi:hypothetical protein
MMNVRQITVLLVSAAMAGMLLASHLQTPLVADAFVYQFYAIRAREWGLFDDLGTLRAYGYPLFLSWLTWISGLDHLRLSIAAGVTQYALYLGGVLVLAYSLRSNGRIGQAVVAGLLLNPWLLAQVTDSLTEAPTLILLVWIAALTLLAGRAGSPGRYGVFTFCAAALVAATVIVRPGSLVIALAWHMAMVLGLLLRKSDHRWWTVHVLGVVVSGVIVWGPQAAYNYAVADRLAFPLICKLGDLQLSWGIRLWRYETLVGPEGAAPWYYPNPLFAERLPTGPAAFWYVQYASAGAVTVLAHLFNAFSIHYLFTYVRDLQPWYGWLLKALSWAVAIAGVYQFIRLALHYWRRPERWRASAPEFPLLTFLGLGFVSSLVLVSVTAVEARFNLLPLALVSVAAAYVVIRLVAGEITLPAGAKYGFGALLALAMLGAWGMDRLGSPTLPFGGPVFDFREGQCFLSIDEDPEHYQKLSDEHRRRFSIERLSAKSGPVGISD